MASTQVGLMAAGRMENDAFGETMQAWRETANPGAVEELADDFWI